jgi:hypothetical protein
MTQDTPKLWRDMTPEEKGALLLAHHEGKVIENSMYGEHWGAATPSWCNNIYYRVRPEPKRKTLTLYGQEGFCWAFTHKPENHDTHCITFDTIDGVPDCSSVKMERIK